MKIRIINLVTALGIVSLFLLSSQVKAYPEPDITYFKVVNVQNYLNIRDGPNLNSLIVGKLDLGTNIEADIIQGKGRNKWAHIGDGYWVSLNHLKERSGFDLSKEYHVNTNVGTDNLNLRNGPGRNQKVLKSLPNGTTSIKVLKTVKKDDGWWARIRWNGKVGWVHSKYLDETEIYTVKNGDTLYSIMGGAYKLGARMNNLSEPYMLSVGQRIRIPYVHLVD